MGKKLLLRVSDIMGSNERLPVVSEKASVREALFEITSKGYGATIVVDDEGRLKGIFTDAISQIYEDQENGSISLRLLKYDRIPRRE